MGAGRRVDGGGGGGGGSGGGSGGEGGSPNTVAAAAALGGRPLIRRAGLYTAAKQKKPAAAKLEQLWGSEWTTRVVQGMPSSGAIEFEGFYGTYRYTLRSGARECTGELTLLQPEEEKAPGYYAPSAPIQTAAVKCNWKGHVHVPVWATPAVIALLFVGCLIGCYRRNTEHMAAQAALRKRDAECAGGRRREGGGGGRGGGGRSSRSLEGPAGAGAADHGARERERVWRRDVVARRSIYIGGPRAGGGGVDGIANIRFVLHVCTHLKSAL